MFCEARIPPELRDQVRLVCSRHGNSITIAERRPPWNPELMGTEWTGVQVAQLRFDPGPELWSLYCRDSSERWWLYDDVGPSEGVDLLLARHKPSHLSGRKVWAVQGWAAAGLTSAHCWKEKPERPAPVTRAARHFSRLPSTRETVATQAKAAVSEDGWTRARTEVRIGLPPPSGGGRAAKMAVRL
ncbi:MAG: DUF3024 domain-containing protein [Solirubrobacteraceae bacterium]